jgi:hypothetical protein
MGFYGEYVKEWGLGDDEDIFWRLYEGYRDGVVKPVFNGNIMTRNILTGRWHHCRNQKGAMDEFKKRFREVHGVDPYEENTSKSYNV